MEKAKDLESIVNETIFQKMRQETRSDVLYKPYPLRQYSCEICGYDYPTKRCPIANKLKWCGICGQMTNHDTRECYYHSSPISQEKSWQPLPAVPIQAERERLDVG